MKTPPTSSNSRVLLAAILMAAGTAQVPAAFINISAPQTTNASTVVLWHLDASSGTTAASATGSNNGTLNGAGWSWTAGKYSNGVAGPGGLPDSITTSLGGGIFTNNQVSMSAWFKPTAIAASGTYALGYDDGVGGDPYSFIRFNSATSVTAAFQVKLNDTTVWAETSANVADDLTAGQWTHIAATWDNGTVRLWINGQMVAADNTYSGNGYQIAGTPGRFGVNGPWFGDDRLNFIGTIDEVQLSSTADIYVTTDVPSTGKVIDISAQQTTNSSTVVLWHLNASSGTTAASATGSNDGTLNGAGWSWTAGKYSNGVAGPGGLPDSITTSLGGGIFTNNQVSMSAWFKPTAIAAFGTYALGYDDVAGGDPYSMIRFNSATSVTAGFRVKLNDTTVWAETSANVANLTNGQWTHIAATWDNGTARLWVNGTLASSVSNYIGYQIAGTPDRFGVNGPWFGDDRLNFIGTIDEVQLSSTADTYVTVVPTGRIVEWNFEEGSGTVAVDSADPVVDGANTGTIAGSAYSWTTGPDGGALGLAPVYAGAGSGSSYATTAMNSGLDLFSGNRVTIAAWINPDGNQAPGESSYVMGTSGNDRFSFLRFGGNGGNLNAGFRAYVPSLGTLVWIEAYGPLLGAMSGVWNYVAATFDRGVVTLYVNGTAVGTNNTYASDAVFQPATSFIVGGAPWAPDYLGGAYSGQIDSAQVMNILDPNPPYVPPAALAYNDWLLYYPDLSNTAGSADPDGDGFDNNTEYAFGGNPTVGTPALLSMVSTNVSFVALNNATNSYTVQQTTNLATGPWTTLGVTPGASTNQTGIPLPEFYTRQQFPVPPGASRGFYRVLFSAPAP